MVLQEILARRNHMLDDFVEPVQFLPCLTIGLEATYSAGHLAPKKEMIEQHHGIRLAALEHVQ